MRSTDEIINKHFSHSFLGYDMKEVDFFLDEIIERLEKLESERKEMLSAMEALLRQVEALEGETVDGKKLSAAQSAQKRLNGGIAQSPANGPVRVKGGAASGEDMQTRKKRQRPASAPKAREEADEIAIEVETEEFAPDVDEILPELLDDMAAVLDEGLQRRSAETAWPGEAHGEGAPEDGEA